MDDIANTSPAKPPFSIEQLQKGICTIFLLEARKLTHLAGGNVSLAALGIKDPVDRYAVLSIDSTAADAGLKFQDVAESEFARAMLDHYDYAFLGVTGTRSEAMEWDSIHTFLGAYALDLRNSAYVNEWLGEGVPDLQEAIEHCLYTVELSNARVVLESGEPFYHFSGSRDGEAAMPGELTIRQLAMLAGIEEMSLRSIISRKTAPVLQVEKTSDRRTVIDAKVAKEWLKAKGRYLPIRKGRRTEGLDLARTSFADINDFIRTMVDRSGVLLDRGNTDEKLRATLAAHNRDSIYELEIGDLSNERFMHDLAEALQLPQELFVMRAAEAELKTVIWNREYELKQIRARLSEALSQPNSEAGAESETTRGAAEQP